MRKSWADRFQIFQQEFSKMASQLGHQLFKILKQPAAGSSLAEPQDKLAQGQRQEGHRVHVPPLGWRNQRSGRVAEVAVAVAGLVVGVVDAPDVFEKCLAH